MGSTEIETQDLLGAVGAEAAPDGSAPSTSLAGDFAAGQRRQDATGALPDFARGQRAGPHPATVGHYAVGQASVEWIPLPGPFSGGWSSI